MGIGPAVRPRLHARLGRPREVNKERFEIVVEAGPYRLVHALLEFFGGEPTCSEVITELSATELRGLLPTLESGMVPKMEACLRAVEGGLTRATVVDGRVPHALLLEIFTNVGIGTMVTQDGLVRLGSRVFSRDEGIPPHEDGNGEFQGVRP